ncbi:MAG: hypothetical protein ISR82_00195 [Candidatus Marinimicrobia bacterium]|nr:hypothetical protein [Candidatus Neomarinimicrobiota bacterium]MBL7009623.1 hypothetical protein [Candidatus Neomarinimicrobiota bacterium]
MKQIMLFILFTILLVVTGCEDKVKSHDEIQESSSQNHSIPIGSWKKLAPTYEQQLKELAKAVAKALEVPEVASYLKEEIGKKFDGDYEVLWKDVKDHPFVGKGNLRTIVANHLDNQSYSIEDIEQVPKLQIALPVGFEEWDGTTPIKVAYTPLTIDDTEIEVINAYDASGNQYELNAKIPPDFTLMAVSINERTDANGNVTYYAPNQDIYTGAEQSVPGDGDDEGGGGGGGGGGNSYHWQKLYEVRSRDYKEPFIKGDPEVRLKYIGFANGTAQVTNTHNLDTVFDTYWHWHIFLFGEWHYDHDWHDLDRNLFIRNASSYGDGIGMYWYEYDGGDDWTFSVNFGSSFSVNLTIKDGDDPMGHVLVPYNYSSQSRSEAFDTGDILFTMYHH